MLTIVSRNPALVCSVSAVPTCVRGVCSVTSAENCAESATAVKPQTIARANRSGSGAPNRSGDARQHAALATIAAPATRALPHSSAHCPATTHPTAPLAIVTNARSDPIALAAGRARDAAAPVLSDVAAKAAIHVHIAYNSHICPK